MNQLVVDMLGWTTSNQARTGIFAVWTQSLKNHKNAFKRINNENNF